MSIKYSKSIQQVFNRECLECITGYHFRIQIFLHILQLYKHVLRGDEEYRYTSQENVIVNHITGRY